MMIMRGESCGSRSEILFFLHDWAKSKGFTLIIDVCDGRESSDLIDGMAVDDVWCWLLPNGVNQKKMNSMDV